MNIMFSGIKTKDGKVVYGDLVHAGEKCYIHPHGELRSKVGEQSKYIVLHEVKPQSVEVYIGGEKIGVK